MDHQRSGLATATLGVGSKLLQSQSIVAFVCRMDHLVKRKIEDPLEAALNGRAFGLAESSKDIDSGIAFVVDVDRLPDSPIG